MVVRSLRVSGDVSAGFNGLAVEAETNPEATSGLRRKDLGSVMDATVPLRTRYWRMPKMSGVVVVPEIRTISGH